MEKLVKLSDVIKSVEGCYKLPGELNSQTAYTWNNGVESVVYALKSLPTQDEWVKCSESPEVGKDYFISNKDDEWVSIGFLSIGGEWYNNYDVDCPCYPTHYRPLPNKPIK